MKKFISAIVSLVLAGSMTLGLAACGGNNQGGNDENGDGGNGGNNGQTGEETAEILQNAIDATLALPNYTLTEIMQASMSLKYNGEALKPEDELGTVSMGEGDGATTMPITGALILNMFGMEESEELYDEITTFKYDFINGKVAKDDSYYDYEAGGQVDYIKYVEVEGTTINFYEKNSVYNTKTEYVGYADNATAKKVLQNSYDMELNNIFDAEFKGVGENSEREGTILELLDLFTAESDGKTYSAKLKSLYEMPFELEYKLTVEDGKMIGFNLSYDGEIDFVEYLESMGGEGLSVSLNNDTDKITVASGAVEGMEITNIGSTSISIPAEDKVVDKDNVHTEMVLSDKALYEKMFADKLSDEGTVSLRMSKSEYDNDTKTSESTSVTVTVNEQLNIAKVKKNYRKYVDGDRVEDTVGTTLYWATDDGMKIYTAEYNGGNYFDGWSEEVITEAISGSKFDALIAKLPQEMQVYFNLNGKRMAEQFNQLKIVNYTKLATEVTVNGKKVPVQINYDYYSDGVVNLNDYYYGDVSVSVSVGYLNSDARLPEIGTTTVTEEQWKELVTPWININNVTIKTDDGTTLIDIAEDGTSGKIYFLGNRSTSIYAEFAPSTEAEGQLTMKVYTLEYYWNSQTERNEVVWSKKELTSDTFEDLLVKSGLRNYYYNVQRLVNPYYGSSYDKTILEIYDEVAYNAMLQTYNFGYYSISFVDGTLIWRDGGGISFIMMNCGTTVPGEIPAEALATE